MRNIGDFLQSVFELIREIIRRPWPVKAAALLVSAGVAKMTVVWWIPFIEPLFQKHFDVEPDSASNFEQGLVLIGIGIFVYFLHYFSSAQKPPESTQEERPEPDRRIAAQIRNKSPLSLADPLHPFVPVLSTDTARQRTQHLVEILTQDGVKFKDRELDAQRKKIVGQAREFLHRLNGPLAISEDFAASASGLSQARLIDQQLSELISKAAGNEQ
ncbi:MULTISPECIES: hypothetical protein [unclassified Meridianimarinicoccus]|uniref:hypothetical protein n=1 Tax=unclassified Meridianimarinicoccus TaxID=2923344 RepID=UPI00186735AD|nr:hypothetical protein [Fluviibacterium sp. MJW13]